MINHDPPLFLERDDAILDFNLIGRLQITHLAWLIATSSCIEFKAQSSKLPKQLSFVYCAYWAHNLSEKIKEGLGKL
jgi:hypothetical protein